jgi:hypothetical protein
MKYNYKTLFVFMAVSTLVVCALLFPQRAHAVVATLVQVVNTTASPVASLDISKTASQIQEVNCVFTAPGTTSGDCTSTTPGAANGGVFTVPPGQKFIITTVDIIPAAAVPSAGFTTVTLIQSGAGREDWIVDNSLPMTQLQFPTGIVIGSGFSLQMSVFGENGMPTTESMDIHGYLTPN